MSDNATRCVGIEGHVRDESWGIERDVSGLTRERGLN